MLERKFPFERVFCLTKHMHFLSLSLDFVKLIKSDASRNGRE
jgi:hypothetical protein